MEILRKISDLELMLCDVQEFFTSCTVQFLMQFTGNISIEEIEYTINEIVMENPGINVCKNKYNWVKTNERVKVENILFEDDINLLKEDLFNEPVDFNKRSIQVYLLNIKNKEIKYLVFKFFHGVVDGKGAYFVVENFINKICGKETYVLKNDITDSEFLESIEYYDEKMFFGPIYNLENINRINGYKLEWNVITIDNYIQNITAKIANVLQGHFLNDNVKFLIPVDLRNYDKGNKKIGNLIIPLYLDVNKNDNSNIISGRLFSLLKNRKELNMRSLKWYNSSFCPEKVRKFIFKIVLKFFKNKNNFSFAGLISHLGRMSFNKCSKINIENIISLPSRIPLTVCSIAIVECENKTNIVICSYENQIPNDLLKSIIEEIKEIK